MPALRPRRRELSGLGGEPAVDRSEQTIEFCHCLGLPFQLDQRLQFVADEAQVQFKALTDQHAFHIPPISGQKV